MGKITFVKSNLLPNVKKPYNFFAYASIVLTVVAMIMYFINGKTQYSAWSKVKSVKTK